MRKKNKQTKIKGNLISFYLSKLRWINETKVVHLFGAQCSTLSTCWSVIFHWKTNHVHVHVLLTHKIYSCCFYFSLLFASVRSWWLTDWLADNLTVKNTTHKLFECWMVKCFVNNDERDCMKNKWSRPVATSDTYDLLSLLMLFIERFLRLHPRCVV